MSRLFGLVVILVATGVACQDPVGPSGETEPSGDSTTSTISSAVDNSAAALESQTSNAEVVSDKGEKVSKQYNQLNKQEARVILQKGTEYPGTGEYEKNKAKGTYVCRQCNAPALHQ